MFSPRKKSERLRMMGAIVLALGIVAAGIFYWNGTHRPADDNLDTMLDGYSRATQHEMGVQMGTMGLIMLGWQQTLARPIAKALIIVAVAGLFASYFFRVAWVLDDDERDERDRLRMEKDA
jgi:amino acid transporter